MYYESTINPIRNEKGELEGVYMAGRNVTEMVESFHHQQEGFKQLSEITKSIKTYISNVNYALRVSEVRLVNYVPSKYTLELSDNLNETQLYLSQLRCIRLGTPRFRRAISSALNRMDHRTTHPVELLIETEIHDEQRRPVWLQFNMIPLLNAEGQVERYFGMCRNMTQMVETERQLAIESQKAQETELLKQAFLTNMSYEIRTPLNTVIGFAELFESEHDEADEPLFVNEIRQNSNSLLQLVNDILFLSRLDANMIEFKKEEADFAMLFESWCQMGLVNVNPEVKVVVENPYERLLVSIDLEHVGKILERLCSVSVSYTEKGTIRTKYEYRHGELAISIEDTGRGIDEKTLPRVFERFVRDEQDGVCGTGLDLPIVQALVQQMGGTIEMQSEYGKGTTVWVFIPCEASVIEKRREIV
jgi:signal transduction histidine kinase